MFSWMSLLLFGLIFVYGILGLFRIADFNVWGSLGLTIPATICGVLGHADRLSSLKASLFGSHLSVTMNEPDKSTASSGDESGRGLRNPLPRNGEDDRQKCEGKGQAQKNS